VRRFALPLLIALSLTACGKHDGKAFLDSRTPPSLGPRFWKPQGWAWGVIRLEGVPEIRYGVASSTSGPGGKTMIIATGYGESAEVYYETVRDLNARGWTVWVIEPHGQGGSGRFPGETDIARSAGFDKDAAAIRWLVENVIRPAQDDQVVLAGHDTGAISALMALESGLARIDRVVLWAPRLAPPGNAQEAKRFSMLGLGFLRAEGSSWKRPRVNISGRATLSLAWPVANPDLRMGGPGWSWSNAIAVALEDATSPAALDRVRLPVTMSGPATGSSAASVCRALPRCVHTAGPRDEHLAPDVSREAWLDRLTASAPAHVAPRT
jgi:lysophospholipase